MTVKISKSALNLREELADLRKPSGIAGEALLRADSVQDVRDTINAGRKNLLINGGFDVWQRGTSFTDPLANTYTADRWFNGGTDTSTTWSKQTATLPTGEVASTLRMDFTASVQLYIDPYQGIEDFRFISNRTVTLSCWVRTNISGVTFRQYSTKSIGDAVEADGEWQRYTATTTLGNIQSLSKGVNSPYFGLSSNASIALTSGDFLEFTHFQLELGSVATEFEHRSYGEELALCERYLQYRNYVSYVEQQSSSYRYLGTPLIPEMRTTPTITRLGNWISGANEPGTLVDAGPTDHKGIVLYQPAVTKAVGGKFKFDAEL